MAGMKFRKSCDLCNVTFFTPNRNALYCAKCAKKVGVAEPSAPPAARPARVAVADSGAARGSAVVAAKPRGPVLVKKPKKGPRPPKPTELTAELRDKISNAYREAAPTSAATIRELHAVLAEKLWVRRWMVAEVIQDLSVKDAKLTAEQKLQAAHMYRDFVESHERPEGGRRKTIAAKLGVPTKEVVLAVRDWARKQEAESPTPKLSRMQLFDIEKTYWDEIEARRYPLEEFPQRIAERLGFANRWQVLRWVDVLHDDPHTFEGVPDPDPEVRDAIVNAYETYIQSDAPPEKGLHQTIADEIGGNLKPRQVHKVLQNYRHQRRKNYSVLDQ
jgi:hypothetical protein